MPESENSHLQLFFLYPTHGIMFILQSLLWTYVDRSCHFSRKRNPKGSSHKIQKTNHEIVNCRRESVLEEYITSKHSLHDAPGIIRYSKERILSKFQGISSKNFATRPFNSS